ANPSSHMLRSAWRLLGEGLDDDEAVARLSHDASTSMSAGTAVRLLRRAAEAAGGTPGEGPLPLDEAALRLKARRDRERLDTVVRYGFSRGCRTRFIYDYFAGGARGGAAPRCGTCDVCLGWGRGGGRPLDDDELLRVRIALSGVGRLSGRFGIERIAQVLTGSKVREVLDRGLDRIPTYGKLAGVPADEVKDLLNVLADAGLIERHGIEGGRPGAFVLALTPEGRRVAKGQDRPELALPAVLPRRSKRERSARRPSDRRPGAAPAPGTPKGTTRRAANVVSPLEPSAPPPEPDPALLERLRAWRRDEARRRGVPSY